MVARSEQPLMGAAAKAGGWRSIPTPSLTTGVDNQMLALDCAGRRCTGAGLVGSSSDAGTPLVLAYRVGDRTEPTVRRLAGAAVGTLPADISCPSPRWCAIVGSIHTPVPADRTWAVVGAGTSWIRTRVPNPGNGSGSQAYLAAVSCVSVDDCLAVGHYFDAAGRTQSLVVRWDGSAWRRILRTQLPGRTLSAVDCPVAGRCLVSATRGELGEFWWIDDDQVSQVSGSASPAPLITDISCPTPSWCAASADIAGQGPGLAVASTTASGAARWRMRPVRSNRATGPLNSMTCPARAECVAGASWVTQGGYQRPGVWEWSGSTKRTVRMLRSARSVGQVNGTACLEATCVATGQSYRQAGAARLQNNLYQRAR